MRLDEDGPQLCVTCSANEVAEFPRCRLFPGYLLHHGNFLEPIACREVAPGIVKRDVVTSLASQQLADFTVESVEVIAEARGSGSIMRFARRVVADQQCLQRWNDLCLDQDRVEPDVRIVSALVAVGMFIIGSACMAITGKAFAAHQAEQ